MSLVARCPVCDERTEVEDVDPRIGPCPQCGTLIELDENGNVVDWDKS